LPPHSVHVLDASPEAVAIANEKVSDNVTWTIGNIFEHGTERRYDTVFFGFWLSHVPENLFDTFWALATDRLKRDGRVFFIDNADPEVARHVAPRFFNAGRWAQRRDDAWRHR
jgi:16S rRNA G1207 methylase RsmC